MSVRDQQAGIDYSAKVGACSAGSWQGQVVEKQLRLSCPCLVHFFLKEKHCLQRSEEVLASPGMCNIWEQQNME